MSKTVAVVMSHKKQKLALQRFSLISGYCWYTLTKHFEDVSVCRYIRIVLHFLEIAYHKGIFIIKIQTVYFLTTSDNIV